MGKTYLFLDNEAFHPKKYSRDEDCVSTIEVKAVEILSKFLKKEKDLMDRILGKDYKRLNRIFDIAQIKYDERLAPAYTRTMKPSIENVTKKKRGGGQLAKKLLRNGRLLLLLVLKSLGEVMKIWVRRLLVNWLMMKR